MKACANIEPQLSAWLDSCLSGRQARAVQRHLAGCRTCDESAESLRRTRVLLRSVPSREVPDGLFSPEAVGRRAMLFPHGISTEPPPAPRGRRSRRMVSVAAGVAMLLIAVTLTVGDAGQAPTAQPLGIDQLLLDHQQVTSGVGVAVPIFDEEGLPEEAVVVAGEMVTLEWLTGPDSTAVVSRTVVQPGSPRPSSVPAVALADKYDAVMGDVVEIMDRLCRRMDVHLAVDGSLREQVWIDESTGVLLRRETYLPDDTVNPVRLVSFLDIDFPDPTGAITDGGPAGARDQPVPDVAAIDDPHQVAALRRAGWTVPPALPNGYDLVGAFVRTDSPGMPLQMVFSDGLYAMSLFAQPRGTIPTKLPAGSIAIAELPDHAGREWPGQSPSRMAWTDEDHTYVLVGNAPRQEMLAMVAGLPSAEASSTADRLWSGLARLLRL